MNVVAAGVDENIKTTNKLQPIVGGSIADGRPTTMCRGIDTVSNSTSELANTAMVMVIREECGTGLIRREDTPKWNGRTAAACLGWKS